MKRRAAAAATFLAATVLRGQAAPGAMDLSRRNALQLAMTNLLQGKIARELREEVRQEAKAQEGPFDWRLSASAFNSRQEFGDQNPRASGLDSLYLTSADTTLDTRGADLQLSRLTPLGGTLDLGFRYLYQGFSVHQYSQTLPTGPAAPLDYASQNPYSGHLDLGFTQPLLKGFGETVTSARLLAAVEEAQAGDEQFRQRMEELLGLVDGLYWDLVQARQNLENKQTALDLARKQLAEDQDRVHSGMLAPIELPQVEASVAQRVEGVIAARGEVLNAQNALLERLFPEGDKPAAVNLLDKPETGPRPLSFEEARTTALARRPELAAAGHVVSAHRILETEARNATLPRLDAQVALTRDTNTHPDPSGVWTDWGQGSYPGYYLGLRFSFPLGNRIARARLAQARAATRGSELVLKDTRTGVLLGVERAYNDLTAAREEVGAADQALAYRIQSLDAEMTKLDNGMSTSFFVLQRQEELDQSKTQDLEARIAAEKARTSLALAMGTLDELLR